MTYYMPKNSKLLQIEPSVRTRTHAAQPSAQPDLGMLYRQKPRFPDLGFEISGNLGL